MSVFELNLLKHIVMTHILALLLALFIPNNVVESPPNETIQWMTFEEAVAANQTTQKKFLVDVYTDWCGWCKVMDRKTFTNPEIVSYINEHFYAVKLNAEQRETIHFNDVDFVWHDSGRNGIHELAYSLLDGEMSYPAFVFLTEDFKRIRIAKGFKQADGFMKDLTFAAEEKFKS